MSQDMTTFSTDNQESAFHKIRRTNEYGYEYWNSRDMAQVLGYTEYRHFEQVIKKARLACFNSGQKEENHFGECNEMVEIGSDAKRAVKSVMLSRYACYLIIQNADPSKDIVAKGQTYFAIQTRRQEMGDMETDQQRRSFLRNELKVHNRRLAGTAKNAGVETGIDYAIFQNHGYMGLYGGLTAEDIHRNKGLKKGQHISDYMGSTELAANLFRATQTEEKIRREKIVGKEKANKTHHEVGEKVRQTIKDIGGTLPEHLPMAEDIKKIGRKHRKLIE